MIEGIDKAEVSLKISKDRTILLIHGLWMTPLSWEYFEKRFQDLGFQVMKPGWPGHEGDILEIREKAESTLVGLGLEDVVKYYKDILNNLNEPPILIGHSFGGLIVQILMDHGFGAAGVTLDSAAPKGIHKLALAQLRSLFPVLSDPRNRYKVVELTFKQFHYAFANTMSEADAKKAYERYTIPDTGKPLFQSAFSDLISHATTGINYKNNTRSPLLLLAGSGDHTVPATVSKANYEKYNQSKSKTDFHVFTGRSHLIMVEEGWQEVVDYINTWLNKTLEE